MMNRSHKIFWFSVILFVATQTAFGQAPKSDAVGAQQVAIPSYIYPCNAMTGCYWTQLLDGAPPVKIALINPNNGPGTTISQDYVDQVARAHARGIIVLGYVYSSYGRRGLPAVKADIDRHYSWYGVDGIFVDEGSIECWRVKYYANLYRYIKNRGPANHNLVAVNPGAHTNECYFTTDTTDIVVNFEGNFTSYQSWQLLSWEANYPPQRFWHLLHTTNEAEMAQAVCLSKQRNAFYIYVTSDALIPNPWDTLPVGTYWNTLLQLAGAAACPP